jgi:hypothetical protein
LKWISNEKYTAFLYKLEKMKYGHNCGKYGDGEKMVGQHFDSGYRC